MKFNKMWEKNHEDRLAYNEYSRLRQHRWNPRLNAISREANKLAGGIIYTRRRHGMSVYNSGEQQRLDSSTKKITFVKRLRLRHG